MSIAGRACACACASASPSPSPSPSASARGATGGASSRGHRGMIRIRIMLLSLVIWACIVSQPAAAAEAECVIGDDGTCAAPPEVFDCVDSHESCSFWQEKGECENNPKYMLENCRKSCSTCKVPIDQLQIMIEKKLEPAEPNVDATELGVEQLTGTERQAEVEARIANVTNYFETVVKVEPKYAKVVKDCKYRHENCAFWAVIGECEANPTYMQLQCAPACYTCNLIDFDQRCPFDPEAPTILNPGDVNQLFQNITTLAEYAAFEPRILSMPNPTDTDVKDGPWVVTLENFLTDEECDTLIGLGAVEGYKVSQDVGKKKFDGTYEGNINSGRTSTNAWCQKECFSDPVTQRVLGKIVNVTGVPDDNSEYLQLLKYEVGQFYQQHHDYIGHHLQRAEGVRILTVFLYLNDVEAGGGTDFPKLGLTVMPKRGKAVIWPSVLDSDPNLKDDRTDHQALPVEKGIKYGANAWLHQKNFKEAFNRSCH